MDITHDKKITANATNTLPILVNYNLIHEFDTPLLYLHWHKEFEFILVTSGKLQVTIEGRLYTVSEGECVFIHPQFIHSATSIVGQACSFYTINFMPNYLIDNEDSPLYSDYMHPLLIKKVVFKEHLTRNEPWSKHIFSLLHDVATLTTTSKEHSELILRGKLYEVWHIYFQHSNTTSYTNLSRKKALKLSCVLEYIHENYSLDLSLKQLADIIQVSESQLCRLFKEELKISPFTYIIRHRILASCNRLQDSDEKISVIANQIGFSNISYYNREFKNIVGCTPSEYRKYCTNIDTQIKLTN